MRFEVFRVLDAIERRLSIDPVVAAAVVDLAEVTRLEDLDGGRSANLLRLGLIVDALGQRLGDSAAALYVVADRSMMSDTELTSNERMVIRRWSDDGLIEVLPAGVPVQARIREISALTGLSMITRIGGAGSAYAPVPAPGGIALCRTRRGRAGSSRKPGARSPVAVLPSPTAAASARAPPGSRRRRFAVACRHAPDMAPASPTAARA